MQAFTPTFCEDVIEGTSRKRLLMRSGHENACMIAFAAWSLRQRLQRCPVSADGHLNHRGHAAGADIEAVARLAGVSTATVSRALRGLPNVSADTRARCWQAARDLDYVISPSASRLASGQTRSVGVVTPYLGRWFFGQVLSGAEEVLREAGYDVLLYALPDDAARAELLRTHAPSSPGRWGADPDPADGRRRDRAAGGTGGAHRLRGGAGHRESPACASMTSAAARVAVNHLVNLGHERIAMIGGGPSEPIHFTVPHDRLAGYRGAMADAGLPDRRRVRGGRGLHLRGGRVGHGQPALPAQPTDRRLRAVRRDGPRCHARGPPGRAATVPAT